jgi:hypothetical protein
VHVTRGYHALALDFALAVDDDDLRDYLEWLLDGFEEPDVEAIRYDVVLVDGSIRLRNGDDDLLQSSNGVDFVGGLVQWLNQQVTDPEYAVMSHAGAVARDGAACVLPAHMESGKTTLTTGLVRCGFDYVTDEAVAFDLATGEIEPYPKPLSIDPGSQFLFPDLEPPLPRGEERPEHAQWQVPPDTIRTDSVASRCRARWVVFPKYERDAETGLEPMTRAEGLVELARNTFRFREHPRRSLDVLAGVIREVDCYRLRVGDLDDACATIATLMDEAE